MRLLLACVLVLFAVIRITSTYRTFNHTVDEAHFAAGLEWIAEGDYTYEWQHPPLARIALAIGPWLHGVKPSKSQNIWAAANEELGSGKRYWTNLTLARIGVLPFFLLACWVLWAWSRDMYGETAALAAVGIFTMLPPILAHAGFATLDLAAASTMLFAGYAWMRWLIRPSFFRGFLLGLAVSLAVYSKFSALLFLPVIFGVVAWQRFTPFRKWPFASFPWRRARNSGLLAFAVLWIAGVILYRGNLHAFFEGIGQVMRHNSSGHDSWLLGQYRSQGWWYFFPVVVGVKTPVYVLFLAASGLLVARLPGLIALGILASCLPAHINLGVRHILIIYPFLAMSAGATAGVTLKPRTKSRLFFAVCAALAIGIPSLRAHPDYLSYFNEFVKPGTESHYLAESDLDWGQDLERLSVKLKELGASEPVADCAKSGGWVSCWMDQKQKEVYLNYFGSADLSNFDLPPHQLLQGWTPVKGWIAISIHVQTIEAAALQQTYHSSVGPLAWLDQYQPVAMAGKSIRIYHIE